jgi:hypothetical protein
MGLSEILDVNIVADRRTIARWIISPVDIDVRPLSQRSLQHQWNEVGFWLVQLAAPSTWDLQIDGKRDGLSDARRYA